jgi:hypothetical protein
MDFPFLLITLLALPFAAAAVIVGVSTLRRRRLAQASEEPAHRLQADTAGVQDAAVYPTADAPRATSARVHRAAAAPARPTDG